ncbi:CRISPR-associated helicase/endonuclease Cas3 [Paenibacillus sp. OSY-SE]|uniref:CRISPR-associated helicase/endonuclease Cas3 n=1 Tax=Paenibacillus sp. OSY-SE TaxID=1196323 RepID=UPI000375B097|nr:CRISPR-associated helicase/endonuclease Cas3 [Paenibacillus sp. OSY-SE]
MSRIVPFGQCIARPGSLLGEHLIQVRRSVERFLNNEPDALIRLAGLAGICHDIAKCHVEWQDYICKKTKKGPNHSACGAFFFSYLGYHMLQSMGEWERYCIEWLWLVRDIADHHSRLHNLTEDSWLKDYDWTALDLTGIEVFIHEQYRKLSAVKINADSLKTWLKEDAEEAVEEALDALQIGYGAWRPLRLMQSVQKWRQITTSLIAGDRFDVKQVNTSWFDTNAHHQHQELIDDYCRRKQDDSMSVIRIQAQEDIMAQLLQHPEGRFFTLQMPTGYGKTITSMKIASWFGEQQQFQKIVYVGPYLSIIEQTSVVIEEVMQEKALEHHSLALLEEQDNHNQRMSKSQLAVESWAHAIVCTSFHQFGKALFPKQSQDVLRRTFLQNAVIIIDEPQILNPDVWNVFLCGLEALTELMNLKVIFLSATMPPFQYGLSKQPVNLQVKASSNHDRYQLFVEEAQNEGSLASFMKEKEVSSQAVILNTIEDAYRVYRNMEAKDVYLLHGLMIPLHKKIAIETIRRELINENRKQPLYVVSTQIIEAGVDVSFQHVARALPIMPSIVQAAGRVNRHLEGTVLGRVSIFPFYREGMRDTRSLVYPKPLQQITDQLLQQQSMWMESELTVLVQNYYEEMFRHNTYEAAMAYIRDAYEGEWEKLSSFQPFDQSMLTLPVFVPWNPNEEEQKLLPKSYSILQKKFKLYHADDIYERYSDKGYMKRLTFEDQKQFMILFNYYVLNLPVKKALKVASKEDFLTHRIPMLYGTEVYDSQVGLRTQFEQFDNFI